MPGTSTVWEYLCFHASLRMRAGSSPSAVHARVAAVAEQLGLWKVGRRLGGRALVQSGSYAVLKPSGLVFPQCKVEACITLRDDYDYDQAKLHNDKNYLK